MSLQVKYILQPFVVCEVDSLDMHVCMVGKMIQSVGKV